MDTINKKPPVIEYIIRRFFDMAGKKGMRDYPLSIKLKAVRLHLEEGMITREVCEKLGITNKTQLENWCRKYKEFGEIGLAEKKRGRPRKDELIEPKSTEEPLWKRVKRLEMENELLKNYQAELRRSCNPKLPTE